MAHSSVLLVSPLLSSHTLYAVYLCSCVYTNFISSQRTGSKNTHNAQHTTIGPSNNKLQAGGRPPRYAPVPPPPWAPKRLAPPSRRQRSSSFPRPTRSHAHRCSRLTSQHGGEQSGLVTLTFDLSVLNLGPMYTTDRRQTDVRQKHCLMPPPIRVILHHITGTSLIV